jgi:hypothetical protein
VEEHETMKINVTWKDIYSGSSCDLQGCAMSLHYKEYTSKRYKVRCKNDDYYIEMDNKKYDKTKIKDYQIFRKFIDNFDFGYIVEAVLKHLILIWSYNE